MWSPVPKPKVIRRPRPLETFNHRRRKLVKRKNPLEFKPENHFGNRYFGIRHSDITEYLEQQIPSHAFAPVNFKAGLPTKGAKVCQHVRPSTAPAAVPWFGRQSSDVSDWLRKLPPAHLGSDPDNKPLPYFPTKSSIVTDNRWQTRDFSPLPNPLWHYWADRPSSAPLATSPNQVQFGTILDAIKKCKPKPKQQKSADQAPQSGAPTPKSERSNPGSRAETPETPTQSRPCSATGGKRSGTATPQPGATTPRDQELPLKSCQCGKRQAGGGSTTGSVTGKAMHLDMSTLCKVCNCEKAQMTPRSMTARSQQSTPRSPKQPETPPIAESNNEFSTKQCAGNGGSSSSSRVGTPRQGSACSTSTSNSVSVVGSPRPGIPKIGEKNSKLGVHSQRPPTCPTKGTIAKQRAHPRPRIPPVPFNEVIRNSRKAPESNQDYMKNATSARNWASSDELQLMSPDYYATKSLWQDKFQKQQKEGPWPVTVH
ncbi:hypothetical protein R1flu_008878 [Riccia fluitans]|uniref:Uncharacterized protein n=1 Tax=Riccia fluitans TaxID=41844 RepID=A0ABD1Z0G6_9MARC